MEEYKVAPEADQYVRGLFERLVNYEGNLPVASPWVNNPSQLRFDFLDPSYPILDNFGQVPEFEYEDFLYDNESIGDPLIGVDHWVEMVQICAAIRLRLDKALSLPSWDGRREVLPMTYLQKIKLLQDFNVLHISTKQGVSEALTKLGANTNLISPYDKSVFNPENKYDGDDDQARKACSEALVKAVSEATTKNESPLFNIVLAERYSLFWAMALEEDEFGDFPSQSTEAVVYGAINKDRYQHVASLWQNTVHSPSVACEVFVPKIHVVKQVDSKFNL